jgi:methionine synthase II (cobalamin-independent)
MQRIKPPFRAEHVGSLLRPQALREARRGHAAGQLTAAQLRAVEDRAIGQAIRMQEDIGLQAVTDGDFRRSWWHLDFLWGLDGVERHVMEAGVSFAGARTRSEGVRVSGRLGFSGHRMIEDFRFLAGQTRRVPKVTLPAPSAIYGRPVRPPINRELYPDVEALFEDLGQAYRKAIGAFADAGCRYLQLDEVFIAMLCDEAYRRQMRDRGDDPQRLGEQYARLINTAISGIPADMTVCVHLCRGNFRSTFMGRGAYDAVQDVLFNSLNVQGYFMEYDDERSGGFEPLRLLPKGKLAVLGLVTTKSGALESKDHLKRRIDAAARFASLGQLCLSGQCGFASTEEGNLLTEEQQWAKLRLIAEVARDVWGREA